MSFNLNSTVIIIIVMISCEKFIRYLSSETYLQRQVLSEEIEPATGEVSEPFF